MRNLIQIAGEWWPWALGLAICSFVLFVAVEWFRAPLAPDDETDSFWMER